MKIQFIIAGFIQFATTIIFISSIFKADFYTNGIIDSFVNSIFIINPNHSIYLILGILYLTGLLIYLGSFIYNISQLKALKQSVNFENQGHLKQLLSTCNVNIPTNVKIGLSNKVSTPLVFGYFEPIILLPISICTQLSSQEIKLILLHELAHIIRKDYLVNIFTGFTKIILWFNPFSYLVTQKMDLLREMACDEMVLKYCNEPIIYSKALYEIASIKQFSNQAFILAAIDGNEHALMSRIKNINKIKVKATSAPLIITTLLLMFVTLMTLTLLRQPVQVSNNNLVLVAKNTSQIKSNPTLNTSVKLVDVNPKMKLTQINNINPTYNIRGEIATKNNKSQSQNIQNNLASNTNSEYDELLAETRNWIKQRENPNQLANYSNTIDSIENVIAERLLMASIIKNYQLKKSIIEQKLSKAHDNVEAIDYLINSKEWNDILEYEKWAKEYLGRHQQPTGMSSPTTKQQIQYR